MKLTADVIDATITTARTICRSNITKKISMMTINRIFMDATIRNHSPVKPVLFVLEALIDILLAHFNISG